MFQKCLKLGPHVSSECSSWELFSFFYILCFTGSSYQPQEFKTLHQWQKNLNSVSVFFIVGCYSNVPSRYNLYQCCQLNLCVFSPLFSWPFLYQLKIKCPRMDVKSLDLLRLFHRRYYWSLVLISMAGDWSLWYLDQCTVRMEIEFFPSIAWTTSVSQNSLWGMTTPIFLKSLAVEDRSPVPLCRAGSGLGAADVFKGR